MIEYILYSHNNKINLRRQEINNTTEQIESLTLSAFTSTETKLPGTMVNFQSRGQRKLAFFLRNRTPFKTKQTL